MALRVKYISEIERIQTVFQNFSILNEEIGETLSKVENEMAIEDEWDDICEITENIHLLISRVAKDFCYKLNRIFKF